MKKMIYRVNHISKKGYQTVNKDIFKYLNGEEAGFAILYKSFKKVNPKYYDNFFKKFCNNDANTIRLVGDLYLEKSKIKWEMGNQTFNIDNYAIFDPNLSLTAKGILFYMLTKSNEWKFYIYKIAEDTQLSQAQVNEAIDELIANKYLTKKKVINGKKFYYDFSVYEVPYGFELDLKEVKVNENNIQNKQK